MPKRIVQDVVWQAKQLGEEIVKEVVKKPGEMAGQALEQLGITRQSIGQTGQQRRVPARQQAKLAQMEIEDKVKSEQQAVRLKKDLEEEIKKSRLKREEELRQRRQQTEPVAAPAEVQPPQEPTSKRRRGILGGFWDRRAQRAQQQTQPETVGRRVGG